MAAPPHPQFQTERSLRIPSLPDGATDLWTASAFSRDSNGLSRVAPTSNPVLTIKDLFPNTGEFPATRLTVIDPRRANGSS
jgi:hypothetical protein